MRKHLTDRHLDSLGCPACRGPLQAQPGELFCGRCQVGYREIKGYLDFAPTVTTKWGFGPIYLQNPVPVPRGEEVTRAAIVDVMGRNWQRALTAADEDAYIREHLQPVDGPVLDLGCGAVGRTRTLCNHVGIDALIGLDPRGPVLTTIGTVLPELYLVRASRLRLPFRDGTLGAVNCSTMWQQIPEPNLMIAEVGRCLRPGGTFTAFAFRKADSPAYRYFQHRHESTFDVRSFQVADIATWLEAAGMELRHLVGPAAMLLFTARRLRAHR